MKQKEKLPLLYATDSRGAIDNYSREQIITRSPMGETVAIYGDRKHWAAFRDVYKLVCLGPRVFWKKTTTDNATFKDGKLYGNFDMFIQNIIQVFNYNWIEDNKWTKNILHGRKDLWKMVFSGKITNPESLCKTFSRKYFKGAYSYATLKTYAEKAPGAPLWDFYYYTTNPEEALKIYCNSSYTYSLFSDCLEYAKVLNIQINPLWSQRRLREVHQEQIEIRERTKLEKIPDDEIFPKCEADGLSLINNERECYLEGCNMHNCVHSCYWKHIRNGDYLIARGKVNGEYIDLGINIHSHYNTEELSINIDQVHTIYNGNVTATVRTACVDWINKNKHTLENIVRDLRCNKNMPRIERKLEEEIPFPF